MPLEDVPLLQVLIANVFAFLTTFSLVLLAEFADKSQLVIFTIVLDRGHPFKVAIGASLGLLAMTVISILVGTIIAIYVPSQLIQIIAGILFLVLGGYGLYNALLKKEEKTEIDIEKEKKYGLVLFSFISLFFMELGDKTQVVAITLTGTFSNPIIVFLGTITALISLTFLAAYAGSFLAERIPKRAVKIVSASLFIFVGVLFLISAFIPF
ncbi:MAG: TMEM165/GDT1 family protein [Candidatus Helarchaeales archaeon]